MGLDEKVVYCQVDAHLDTNPKIRRAGRDARDVFEFLLRRVAIGRTEGTVPAKYIEPWYLADQLMMSEDEARNGVSRAVTANLISIDDVSGLVRIVGWSAEWGRRPKTNTERQSEFRARKRAETDTTVTGSNDESREVTASNESNVGEERRGEDIERASRPKRAPKVKAQVPEDWRPSEPLSPTQETELVRFRNHHRAKGNTFANVALAWANWLSRSAEWGGGRNGAANGNGEIRPRNQIG